MRVLVALCLLAALPGGRACWGPHLKIYGVEQYYDNYIAQYGDTITIFCTGTQSRNLNMVHQTNSVDDGMQPTKIINRTTIKLIAKPEIESHEYTCIDEVTNCIAKLTVNVKPVITIESPNVQYKRIGNEVNYIVPVGEDYEVICSGNSDLRIRKDGRNVQTRRINDTAVVATKRHEKEQLQLWYECEHELNYGSASLIVAFDYPPAAENFWCIEYNFQINCHWSMVGQYVTFTLFYEDEDGNIMRLYEDHIGTKKTRSCEWSMDDVWSHGLKVGENLSLVLQSCNPIFCSNETYHFNMDQIKKIDSVVGLKLLKTWPQSAVVAWIELGTTLGDNFGPSLEYKVTYRLPGMQQQELKASSLRVTCTREYEGIPINVCEGKLKLPCPGKRYEIKVYRKWTATPRIDTYWSEPANITLRTDIIRTGDMEAIDLICEDESELLELQEELKATERRIDLIRKTCEEKKLDVCSETLSSVCIDLNNTVEELGRGEKYNKK